MPKKRTSGTKLVLLENNWSHEKYSVDCAISEKDSAEQCSSSISKSMSIVSEVSNSQSAESFHWEEKMVKMRQNVSHQTPVSENEPVKNSTIIE